MKTKQCITVLMLFFSMSVFAGPVSKLDSLLNLKYNGLTYPKTVAEIKKLDNSWGNKLDSAIKFMYAIPGNWPMATTYQTRMGFLSYRQIPGYALLVEQDYMLYNKINKQYPIIFDIDGYEDNDNPTRIRTLKPVIYLYPEKEQQTDITLNFTGNNLYTYPKIGGDNSWNVTAKPDGMLTDAKGNSYPYLFWEGIQADMSYINFTEGFVVKVDQLETFLEDKLILLGLTARERTDFITFWAPKQQESKYVFVRFETAAYTKAVPLDIQPAPQSIQRIFAVFMPVDNGYICSPQQLQPFTRKGFTVIEWGGIELPSVTLQEF